MAIPRKDITFYSSVTGTRKLTDFGPSYWVSNLVSRVKFSAASGLVAEHLSAAGFSANVLLEVGPHSALAGPLRQCLSDLKSFKYTYIPALVRKGERCDDHLGRGQQGVLKPAARSSWMPC